MVLPFIVLLAGGIFVWMSRESFPEEQRIPKESLNKENSCEKDEDCACGIHINTGDCFYGNKAYVDTSYVCPDFCTGIKGDWIVTCRDFQCTQQDSESAL